MVFLLLFVVLHVGSANLLGSGISSQVVQLRPKTFEMIGFPQSALNQTEVHISMSCADGSEMEFDVEYVLRSSPCDKEFFDARRTSQLQKLLKFYFDDGAHIPQPYTYDKIMYYRSSKQTFSCKDSHGSLKFLETATKPMQVRKVEPVFVGRKKRDASEVTLTSRHAAQTIPLDGIYFLVIKVTGKFPEKAADETHNLTVSVEWKGPYGFLSAIDYPLLRFYILMCVFYAVLALVWLVLCIKHYKDILRIQFWIGGVIILGMLEKAFFLSEYATMNNSGKSQEGIIELAELVSCAKRTMSRVLVIIVAVGYGVVKPRLGNTLSQVAGVGLVYFAFCSIEGLARVSKNHLEAQKQKQFAALPLVITELVIFYWIYTSLRQTMITLRMKRNEVKLQVYRHFLNTLLFSIVASMIFMMWSMMYHIAPICLTDWKELWVDTAFWHVLFCFILVVIMVLWRPSANNQRYAYTPLLDDSDDEVFPDDPYTGTGLGYDEVKARDAGSGAEKRKDRDQQRADQKLQDDLKWIENHIPASLTDQLLMDEEEEKAQQDLELSKML